MSSFHDTEPVEHRGYRPPGGAWIEDGLWVNDAGDPTCWYCRGEACERCYQRMNTAPCEHDLTERHGDIRCQDFPGDVP